MNRDTRLTPEEQCRGARERPVEHSRKMKCYGRERPPNRGKEASKELSNMKERLLPKESIAICSKSWTRNCNLDLQQRHTEVRTAKINEVQGARGVKL